MRSTEAQDILNIENLDKFVDISEIPPEYKLIDITETKGEHIYDVYTDGSRINSDTGLAVYIFKNNTSTEEYLFRLGSCNTVFQAELAAIDFTAGWVLRNNAKIDIFTDTQSSIDAIKSAKLISEFVNNIKRNIFNARQLISVTWGKAHVGNPGNEHADRQAKFATEKGVQLNYPAPCTYVTLKINQYIMGEWEEYWKNHESNSILRVRTYLDKVDK
ncbi:hypothetical protein AVEN_175598-1 [Araneus ventricosus]|uniref:RNase H type-1 domain-containing protein n=1 Tax=Araneus ventricosus TaxID=182803 RepID=A0A4Y2G4A5_ARAVE|nr:hypothetical protein AVEN_175598-1 [Araneus ventricosus]